MGATLDHTIRRKIMETIGAIYAMFGLVFFGWMKITGKYLDKE
jgi:hypothetical protein